MTQLQLIWILPQLRLSGNWYCYNERSCQKQDTDTGCQPCTLGNRYQPDCNCAAQCSDMQTSKNASESARKGLEVQVGDVAYIPEVGRADLSLSVASWSQH